MSRFICNVRFCFLLRRIGFGTFENLDKLEIKMGLTLLDFDFGTGNLDMCLVDSKFRSEFNGEVGFRIRALDNYETVKMLIFSCFESGFLVENQYLGQKNDISPFDLEKLNE